MAIELAVKQLWRAQVVFEHKVNQDWLRQQLNSIRGIAVEPFQTFDRGAEKWRDVWMITLESDFERDVRERYEEVQDILVHLRQCLADYETGKAMYEQLGRGKEDGDI